MSDIPRARELLEEATGMMTEAFKLVGEAKSLMHKGTTPTREKRKKTNGEITQNQKDTPEMINHLLSTLPSDDEWRRYVTDMQEEWDIFGELSVKQYRGLKRGYRRRLHEEKAA